MLEQDNQIKQPKQTNPYVGLLTGILIILFLNGLIIPALTDRQIKQTDYSSFISKTDSGLVSEVVIKNGQIFLRHKKEKKVQFIKLEQLMILN